MMKNLIITLFAFVFISVPTLLTSQTCGVVGSEIGTFDRTHLIPPIYAKSSGLSDGSDISEHFLYLSTTEVTPFTVTIQDADGFHGTGGLTKTVTLSKDSPALVTLSAGDYGSAYHGAKGIVNHSGLNVVDRTHGLIVTAPERFYANVRHRSQAQGASLTSKGQAAIGKRFRTGHLRMDIGSPEKKSSFFSIMATADNTTVTFGDLPENLQFVNPMPPSVVLNKYESYVIGVDMDGPEENSFYMNELNGTLVTADKGIVMNSGSFLGGAVTNTANRDIGFDQIMPISRMGTDFLVIKGQATTNAHQLESPIVIADTDDTEVFIKGEIVPIATLNAGEYYMISGTEYPESGSMGIRTTHPAYVYQTTNANNSNANGLNFVASILPNLETQPLQLAEVDQLGSAIIYIIAPKTALVTVDDIILEGGLEVPGNSAFVFYEINGKIGHVNIDATEPYFVSTTTLNPPRGSAGYFVGFPNSFAVRDFVFMTDRDTNVNVIENDIFSFYDFDVVEICQPPSNGSATLNPDGTIYYRHNLGFFGVDTLAYKISDGNGVITDFTYAIFYTDADGDGISDISDIDADNDGILNTVELANATNFGDSDMDGVPDIYDVDSDNDGILDYIEAQSFGEIIEHTGFDSDKDGLDDAFEGSGNEGLTLHDNDEDGTFNYLDLDSDGDGCSDAYEGGVVDTELADIMVAPFDRSNVGANGFEDSIEDDGAYAGNYTYFKVIDGIVSCCVDDDLYGPACDFDGDGIPNIDDLDNDNDGILDAVECSDVTQFVIHSTTSGFQQNTGINDLGTVTNGNTVVNVGLSLSPAVEYQLIEVGGPAVNVYEEDESTFTYRFDRPVEAPELTLISITQIHAIGDFTATFADGSRISNLRFEIENDLNGFTTSSSTVANVSSTTIDGVGYVTGTSMQNSATITFPTLNGIDYNGIVSLSFKNVKLLEDPDRDKYVFGLKVRVYCDDDGDGVSNIFDLDSDGDGCSDAYESGTIATELQDINIAPFDSANVGLNGFQDDLELFENGEYVGTYTYENATDFIPYCCVDPDLMGDGCDFDGDGVINRTDLDDDNDGILDAVEDACEVADFGNSSDINLTQGQELTEQKTSKLVAFSFKESVPFTSKTVSSKDHQIKTKVDYDTEAQSGSNELILRIPDGIDPKTSLSLKGLKSANGWNAGMKIELINSAQQKNVLYRVKEIGNAVKEVKRGEFWAVQVQATSKSSFEELSTDQIILAPVEKADFIRITYTSAKSNTESTNPEPIDLNLEIRLCGTDRDGDDLPNSFDLDSDGDGCYDGYEAGVTGATVDGSITDSIAIGTDQVGLNGFSNSLENEDTETATATYDVNYEVAASSVINSCVVLNAIDDELDVNEDELTILDVLDNDEINIGEIDPSSLLLIVEPQKGNAGLDENGDLVYISDQNFNGNDVLEYSVCDITPAPYTVCDTARVVIAVKPVNDGPVARNDGAEVLEDNPVTVHVQNNDSDIENDPLTTSLIGDYPGVVTVNADGSITYLPPQDFVGTEKITYQVCDPGGLCDDAVLTIAVINVNDPPVLGPSNPVSIPEDSPNTEACVTFSDVDIDDSHEISILNPTGNNQSTVSISEGKACVNYRPNEDFNGDDEVVVMVCDNFGACDTVVFSFDVTPMNDGPIVSDDEFSLPEDAEDFLLDVLANDNDEKDDSNLNPGSVRILTLPSNGTADPSTTSFGDIEYNPDEDFFGEDFLTYEVCDNGVPNPAKCDTAEVIITVTPVNDIPIIVIPQETVRPEDAPTSVVCTPFSDKEENDTHNVFISVAPNHGTASAYLQGDMVCIEYDSEQDYFGADTVYVTLCDQALGCVEAPIIFSVFPVNDAPVAVDDLVESLEDMELIIDIQDNDSDVEDDPFLTTILGTSTQGVLPDVLNGDSISYVPPEDFVGLDTFFYKICDLNETLLCDTGMVVVEVLNVNDAPDIEEIDEVVIPEDTPSVLICAGIDDPDMPESHIFSLCSYPRHSNTSVIALEDGQICVDYKPLPNFFGQDSVCIVVCDAGSLCDTITFYIDVTPVNDTPIAVDDLVDGIEDSPIVIDVQSNDVELDGDEMITRVLGESSEGILPVVLNNDSIQYALPPDYIGIDTFYYEVCDIPTDGSASECDTAEVIVNVSNANDAPVISDPDEVNIPEDTTDFSVCIPFIDVDPNDEHTAHLCEDEIEGTAEVEIEDGEICLTYTPISDFFGLEQICISVCDALGACDSVLVPINVINVNDKPIANVDKEDVLEDVPTTIDVQQNDSADPDDDDLITTVISTTAGGALPEVLDGDSILYTSPLDYVGTDTVYYEVCDTGIPSLCDTSYVVVEVENVNDIPELIVPPVTELPEDEEVVVICAEFIDPDPNDTHDVELCNNPDHGDATISLENGQLCITYSPDENFNGDDEICISVCDAAGTCDSIMIPVTVIPVNDAPVAINDSPNGLQDIPLIIDVQNNDQDVEGDGFITTIITNPNQGGEVVVIEDDRILYTPASGYVGLDTFFYEICDTGSPSLCDTGRVVVNVGNVNDPPIIIDPIGTSLPEDSENVMVCGQISDPDIGDVHMATICTDPKHGTAEAEVLNGEVCIIYTPNENYNGPDELCVEVCDFEGLCDETIVTLEVTPVNDPPYLVIDDTPTLPEDSEEETFCLPVSDVDEGDTHEISICGPPSHGTATAELANGLVCVTYEPNRNFFGTVEVCIEICDDSGACTEVEVPIIVTPVNDPPFAFDDEATVIEEQEVTFEAIANDLDTEGDNLFISEVYPSTSGAIPVVVGTDFISYAPIPDFVGLDTFTYLLCDDGIPSLCDEATVIVEVINVNDPPELVSGPISSIPEDTEEAVICIEISDPDPNDTHTPFICGPPDHGDATVAAVDGELCITYTPDEDYNGVDEICVVVCDASGVCDSINVLISILPVNDAPDAMDDEASTFQDSPVTIDIQDNDVDLEGDLLVTYILGSTTAGVGDIIVLDGDSIIYMPPAGFVGIDTITYAICDVPVAVNNLTLCDTAIIVVEVINVNDSPKIEEIPTMVLDEDEGPTEICMEILDPDMDDSHTFEICGAPENGTYTAEIADGSICISYEPNSDFYGEDDMCIIVCDAEGLCDTFDMEITILPVNDAPVAVDDEESVYQDTPAVLHVKDNDSDVDGDFFVLSLIGPSAQGVILAIIPGDSLSYTAPEGFVGVDTVWYKICDIPQPGLGDPVCDTGMVVIDVMNINDAPEIMPPDLTSLPEDTSAFQICVAFEDPDIGDSHSASVCENPEHGIALISVVGDEICVVYTPYNDYYGEDEFCITVCDAAGECDSTMVPIFVKQVNDRPLAVDDYAETLQDQKVVITVQDNDIDIDGDDLITNIIGTSPNGSQVVVLGGDSLLYIPPEGFVGIDTFTYQICDTGTPLLCDVAVIIVEVENVNDAPEIEVSAINEIEEDSADESICITFEDPDIGDTHVASMCGDPIHGEGTFEMQNGMLCVTYTPEPNFTGMDSVCVQVCDALGECDEAYLVIQVNQVNDAPVAMDDEATTLQDQPTIIDVQSNDEDIDDEPLKTTVISTNAPGAETSITDDGEIIYSPAPGFVGEDVITYQVCDAGGLCDTAEVIIEVENVNDAPEIIPVAETVLPEDAEDVRICALFTDLDIGDTHTANICRNPMNGAATASIIGNEICLVYSPDEDYFGSDTLCVQVCDAAGECDEIFVSLDITPVNDAPEATEDVASTIQDHPTTVSVTLNDIDLEDDHITLSLFSNNSENGGDVELVDDTAISYTPTDGFVGVDTIFYIICDDGTPALCDTGAVIMEVIYENDLPIIEDPGTFNIPEDDPITTICTTIDDFDSQDIHSASVCEMPEHGIAFVTLDGRELCVAYQPDPNYSGLDSICIIVCDPQQGCDTETLLINVEAINDKPLAEDDYVNILQNEEIQIQVQDNDSDIDGDDLTTNIIGSSNPLSTTVVVNGDDILYTPPVDFAGFDTITYQICDNGFPNLCDVAIIVVNIGNINDVPELGDPNPITIDEDEGPIQVCVDFYDPDEGDIHTISFCDAADSGTAQAVIQDDEVCLTYESAENFHGTDEVCISICDAAGTCDSVTFEFIVESINDAPEVEDDIAITIQDETIEINVLSNDNDADGDDLTPSRIIGSSTAGGIPTILSNGRIQYTPSPGYVGTDSFLYEVCDNGDPVLCATGTVTVNVVFENDPPVITPLSQPISVIEDASATTICTEVSDPDPGQQLDVAICGMPNLGTAVANLVNGQLCITYEPDADYYGPDSICVQVCDNMGGCSNIIVPVVVSSVNDHPVAQDDNVVVYRDEPTLIDVQINDYDVDSDDLTTSVVGQGAQHGTVTVVNGNMIQYTPSPLYIGPDTITYWLCDQNSPALCDVAQVFIDVQLDPNSDDPDLFPNFTFGRTTFNVGEEAMVILNINEISNTTTTSGSRFFVPNSSGFDYEFDPTTTLVNIFGPQQVQNSEWLMTRYPTGLLFETDEFIPAGSRSRLAIKVTAITPSTKANITVNIAQGSGGETNEINNVAVLSTSIQN